MSVIRKMFTLNCKCNENNDAKVNTLKKFHIHYKFKHKINRLINGLGKLKKMN